ncbi:MAG TPA: hypothetical protein VHC22_23285 [Pirellulales bacterium]|nr:hypothetical protein [Pirellulales bacterium]
MSAPVLSIPPLGRRLLPWALCACVGCALTPDAKKSTDALKDDQPAVDTAAGAKPAPATPTQNTLAAAAQPAVSSTALGQALAKNAAGAAPDPRVLDEVLAELSALGSVQPEAQKRLIEDLRKTDPALWPMLVQTFRATLAYRRRTIQKASEEERRIPYTERAADEEVMQVAHTEPIQAAPTQPAAAVERAVDTPAARPASIEPVAANLPPKQADLPPAVSPATVDTRTAPIESNPSGANPAAANPAGVPWRRHLDAAIAELDRQTRERPNDPDVLANQVYLRLLDVAAGRRDDALKPIPGLPTAQQDYWAKQLYALSTYLDQGSSDSSRRAAEAGLHLGRAVVSLNEQGPLLVRNMAFCTDVHSYGVTKRFEPAEFHADQQVLLYAEVENFKSDESAEGFHTSLEASYEVLDRQGTRVTHDELPLTEEHCQNRRRDFFVRYFLRLPKSIYEGSYTLKLTVEDKLGHKIGQSSIDFTIKKKL